MRRVALAALGCVGLLDEALAAPDDAAEEIVVYGDDFARWDHTRWLVQNELLFPMGTTFAAENNKSFKSLAFQIRTVLLCDKDGKLSKHRYEVSCKIEDIALLATSANRWKREKDRALVQSVLDELDAKLTGLDVQMQVVDDGAIKNFDLEGLQADNSRQIDIQESLRQILARTMAGFHLAIPDHAQRSGQWVEYNSELMDMPSLTASRGSTTMVHQVSPYGEMQLVQTIGEGSASVSIPVVEHQVFTTTNTSDDSASVTIDKGGDGASTENTDDDQDAHAAESAVEVSFALKASGVAVFRKSDGIMSERVWSVVGAVTTGVGGSSAPPFRNVGRIQLLGKDDHPDVGPTEQVSWPTRKMEGLDPWISIEAMPGDTATSGGPG